MVNTKKAFTLVELIVIVTTIAALFTTAFVAFQWDNIRGNVSNTVSPYSYDIESSWDNSYKRMQMATYYDETNSELVLNN